MNFENIYAVPSFYRNEEKYVISVREQIERPNYAKNAVEYFWFPIDEIFTLNSLSSIYAALKIIHSWKTQNVDKIFINCSAGVARSPMIVESYRYLITGNFSNIKYLKYCFKQGSNEDIKKYIEFLNNFKLNEIEKNTQSLTTLNFKIFNFDKE